jgi:hypothetical protein
MPRPGYIGTHCWRPILANSTWSGAGGQTAREFGKVWIESDFIPYFVENTTPSRGKPPQAYIMKLSRSIEALPIASTKILSLPFIFISFALILSSKVPAVAWDVLGGLADLEQPLDELFPTRSFPEKRSKEISAGSRAIQEHEIQN